MQACGARNDAGIVKKMCCRERGPGSYLGAGLTAFLEGMVGNGLLPVTRGNGSASPGKEK